MKGLGLAYLGRTFRLYIVAALVSGAAFLTAAWLIHAPDASVLAGAVVVLVWWFSSKVSLARAYLDEGIENNANANCDLVALSIAKVIAKIMPMSSLKQKAHHED